MSTGVSKEKTGIDIAGASHKEMGQTVSLKSDHRKPTFSKALDIIISTGQKGVAKAGRLVTVVHKKLL